MAWEKVSMMGRTEDKDVDKCANDDGGWTWKKSDMHRNMLLNSHTPPKYTWVGHNLSTMHGTVERARAMHR